MCNRDGADHLGIVQDGMWGFVENVGDMIRKEMEDDNMR